MHFKGILSLCGAIVAAVALVSASGATTTKDHKIAGIDVSSRAAIVHYLRSIHVNPKGLVIQRGQHNYAGARCPGKRWTCTRTTHPVVQIAAAGGKNTFRCLAARCAVVQVAAAAAKPNKAICVRTSGLGASCSITQSTAAAAPDGNNSAMIYENAGQKLTGLTQSASYTASIKQKATGAAASNTACVDQEINIDGSTNTSGKKGVAILVTLEAHQSVSITQDSLSGGNSANQSWDGTSLTCTGSAVTQKQTLTSTATGSGQITQNENDQISPCGDGVAGDNSNMCLDIEQNRSLGFKCTTSPSLSCPATGANSAIFDQESSLSAVANTPAGSVTQTQSSADTPGGFNGGLVGTINQDSAGVSTASATQNETQCEDAAPSGLAPAPGGCISGLGSGDFNGTYQLTQNQYGPEGVWKFRHSPRGRRLYGHVDKGLGASKQTGNDSDIFTINQTSKQDNDQGSNGSTSNQTNNVQGDCSTPGTCTDTQTTNINGSTTTTTQSGQDVNTSTNCTGSTCQTTTPPPEIVGNNAAFGGGSIQTYDFATGALVNSFVPDGATATNANGRAVMVVGNEVFYTELSGDGFGPSDGIHVAPFNNGAGGSDLRVLPNPASSTGIQDLAYAGGYLYALTGYNQSPLQVWKLDPLTGSVIGGPISISGPDPGADGFTVLPDGNLLINDGDGSCTYREYKPSTGLATGTPLSVPGDPSICTGVETDGASLYFQTNFDSFTKTGLNGTLISTTPVASNSIEDISLA